MKQNTFTDQLCELRPSLHGFAFTFTADLDDAQDLVQDTMIKAIRYSRLFKEGTNLKGWLFTIMKNTFINNYHQAVRKRGLIGVDDDLKPFQIIKSASVNKGEDAFVREDLTKAITKLQPEYCVPFLKYFEGFKYHEIALELKFPIGTVKTRIHLARKILKANLKMYARNVN